MIDLALSFLKKHLEEIKGGNPKSLIFNPAAIKIVTSYLPDKGVKPEDIGTKIFITLLSIEEERNAKVSHAYRETSSASPKHYKKINTELNLNLYVMFGCTGPYKEALKNISRIITVFANQNAFDKSDFTSTEFEPLEELWLDIQNISLDQSNNLWQALANHILPHIIYKIRTIAIVPSLTIGKEIPEVRSLELEGLSK
jgi:Pvc16 N-terminal domain